MLLADMGATVIKVESPAGDETRTWTPPDRDGVATYYLSINRNKRSVVLDFNDPDDVELTRELLRRADVAVENFKPGGLRKFGLDYESVQAINPRLVYLSISGFGSAEGAWLPGYDLVVQAVSGLMSLTGEPDGPAYRAGVAVFDVMTGLHGLIGVLAALRQRDETGEGQHVEVSLLASALSGLVNQSGAYAAAGVVPHRMGNAHPSVYPYQAMPTKDRDVIIAAANDRQFRSLCEVLGIAEVADDPRFRLNADRTANRAELHPLPGREAPPVVGRRSVPRPQPGRACHAARSTRSPRACNSPNGSASTRSSPSAARSTRSATRSRSAAASSATTDRRPRSASTATRSGGGCRTRRQRCDGRDQSGAPRSCVDSGLVVGQYALRVIAAGRGVEHQVHLEEHDGWSSEEEFRVA